MTTDRWRNRATSEQAEQIRVKLAEESQTLRYFEYEFSRDPLKIAMGRTRVRAVVTAIEHQLQRKSRWLERGFVGLTVDPDRVQTARDPAMPPTVRLVINLVAAAAMAPSSSV